MVFSNAADILHAVGWFIHWRLLAFNEANTEGIGRM